MIDVHPPHHAVHAWRDFFIHIATIVVGLLIAVGLEQTVEFFHHRHEVTETREALRLERDDNRTRFVQYVKNYRWESVALGNNMLVLKVLEQQPGTPQEKLPGVLFWTMKRSLFTHSAWDTAQQTGVLALMPQDEVLSDQNLYKAFQDITNLNEEEWLALNDATSFLFKDPDPSHLTAAQISAEIDLTKELMTKHYLQGNFMGYPASLDSSFDPGPTDSELIAFHNAQAQQEEAQPGSPRDQTLQRLKAAGYAPKARATEGSQKK